MSVLHFPARMEAPALTNLVITTANVWLHLKVMNTEGEGKVNIINFRKHSCHLSELVSLFRVALLGLCLLKVGFKSDQPIISKAVTHVK